MSRSERSDQKDRRVRGAVSSEPVQAPSRNSTQDSWLSNTRGIIDESQIVRVLEEASQPDALRVREVVEKARALGGLGLEDAAVLLQCEDPASLDLIFTAAREVKDAIYGRRVVLFAPLYYSSACVNNCLYCGFRRDAQRPRRHLTLPQVAAEVSALEREGHRRLLVIGGETTGAKAVSHLLDVIRTVYETRDGGEIRRVNVETAPMSVEDFRELSTARIGTYVAFQETYHRETYRTMHPDGPKADYEWRLGVMDRAMRAGIEDVGIGVLFGLFDYRFDVLGLLQHARHLEATHGTGPHTISVPRIEPTPDAPLSLSPPAAVSDLDLCKIVAILRLAVPYTGIILSTRETPALRDKLLDLGVSQMSAGSCTEPGGYASLKGSASQFPVADTRSLDDVIRSIAEHGYLPSFCTGCYRKGRTGADFMELAKPGLIRMHCLPNALLTYQEYLLDYASEETREVGMALIQRQLESEVPRQRREPLRRSLERLRGGERDIYF